MIKAISVILISVLLIACQSTYYSFWEQFGVEKRDILVERVEAVSEAQEETQQQFSSALEELTALIEFNGGELQTTYEQLKAQQEASVGSAERLADRIDKVQSVAEALFQEWEQELDDYQNETFRRDSERKLKETQAKYRRLESAMKRSLDKIEPVIAALNDNVLYLKHNLNASAIGALQGEFKKVKRDIQSLISEMNQAIEQSSDFINSIKQN